MALMGFENKRTARVKEVDVSAARTCIARNLVSLWNPRWHFD